LLPDEDVVLGRLLAWCEDDSRVRAVVLTSSRANGRGDQLSDYDVVLAVRDAVSFRADSEWVRRYGEPAARWGDEGELLGLATSFLGVVYVDGVKIDYGIWPEELVERIASADELPDGLDVGYRVLLDKDGRTSSWAAPSDVAHIPVRPSEEEYRAVVEEFWWASTYAAKALWRGEVVFAKFVVDHDMKLGPLRRVLEWKIELDGDWSVRPGVHGRGLERLLATDLRDELAATYVGPGVEENWVALDATIALFRRVANEVADRLGYPYPLDADRLVSAHLDSVRRL
jgi:aminoglycoside 6-adenylyltransferase